MQMALTEIKFCHFWIVLSAIFILLSVSTIAEQYVEGHRCHWCGPLAEQVHRSQRASSCDGDIKDKVTICDEGLPYCAIVATSPPYVESRFCVKVYQDECYTVYCNSTKTWKITCPCRGELCNSNNTKRETEAFQALLKNNIAKLSQNQRFKRGFSNKTGFMGARRTVDEAQNNTSTETVIDLLNSTLSYKIDISNLIPEGATIPEKDNSKSRGSQDGDNDIFDSIDIETMSGNIISREGDSSDSSDEETSNESSDTESETESTSSESIEKTYTSVKTLANIEHVTNNPTIQITIPKSSLESGDLKTEIIVMSSELPKPSTDAITKKNYVNYNNNAQVSMTTPATVTQKLTPKTTEIVKVTHTDTKKKAAPETEAIQHVEVTTVKPTQQMTPGSQISVTTQLTTPADNTAIRVDAHILTIVISAMLHYRI